MKFRSQLLNKLFLTAVIIALLVVLLLLTNPNNVALPFLIAPFICIGIIIYHLARLFLSSTMPKTDIKAARMFAASVAFLGVALLLLRSLHQLTLKDTLLVCGFVSAFWLYVWRADFLHK